MVLGFLRLVMWGRLKGFVYFIVLYDAFQLFRDGMGIFVSGVSMLVCGYVLDSSIGGFATESICVGTVAVWWLTFIFLQVLEVYTAYSQCICIKSK